MSWPSRLPDRVAASLGASSVRQSDSRLIVEPMGREGLRRSVEILVEENTPWAPQGGGRTASAVAVGVSTSRHVQIMNLWRDDLVCRVGAGCRMEGLQRQLEAEGMRVPATSAVPTTSTIGGVFARGERGYRGAPNRGLRESVIGLTAVDGAGRLIKAGARVVKNVAGYDLVRLFHGSHGSLGLITDLTVKLEPLPVANLARWYAASGGEVADRIATLRRPSASQDPSVLLWLHGRFGGCDASEGLLVCELEGWDASLTRWAEAAGGEPAEVFAQELWDESWHDTTRAVWQWQLGPRPSLELWPDAAQRLESAGAAPRLLLDLYSGHAQMSFQTGEAVQERVFEAMRYIAAALHACGGSLYLSRPGADWSSGLVGSAGMTDRAATVALHQIESRLKNALDPDGLLPPVPESL